MTQSEYEQNRHDCWIRFKTESMFTLDEEAFKSAFDRAYALGKQEKDADTVISGWIARDANPHSLYIYGREPVRLSNMWSALGRSFAIQIGSTMFPDLTWDSGPEPVEIIIKRKKK